MKKHFLLIVLVILAISSLMGGCSTLAPETPMLPSETTYPVSDPTSTSMKSARFTIQAEDVFVKPISVLYQALYEGESPVFVDSNGDLLVTNLELTNGDHHPKVPVTFIPGAGLTPINESNDVTAFIDFAVSLAGQKALIAAGELPDKIELTDQAGKKMTINQPVERVISAYGPTTAIVYAVHGKDRLVSASYLGAKDPLGSGAMAEIDARFPDIMGDDKFSQQDFNVEEAAILDPDLILTSARSAWLDIAGELEIPLFLYEAETSDRLKEAILLTGNLFGPQSSATAQTLVTYFDNIIAQIQTQTENVPSAALPRVLFTGTDPLRVASGDMYQTEIIEAAGGISVSGELSGYWNDVNLEQVLLWDPDIIIVPPYGGASVVAITESEEWQIIEAVQAGRVYQMPKLVAPWDTPAPDSILGVVWMAQLLHPELVELDCSKEAVYFYNTFYQYAIPMELASDICSYD